MTVPLVLARYAVAHGAQQDLRAEFHVVTSVQEGGGPRRPTSSTIRKLAGLAPGDDVAHGGADEPKADDPGPDAVVVVPSWMTSVRSREVARPEQSPKVTKFEGGAESLSWLVTGIH